MDELKGVSRKISTIFKNARTKTLIPTLPIPLLTFTPVKTGKNTVYITNGITPSAEETLRGLSGPIHILAFCGFGRSGKSFTASKVAHSLLLLAGIETIEEYTFASKPGNVPCTHGIDMMVIPFPERQGCIIILDCEGGGNSNASALPYVLLIP